ncbi:MAG TPA: glucose-6-phosphate isomerase [Thermoplasmata archaeon]|nr:glucose-6-phosphate isomerase [Thermoplasmata archaeon]
MATSSDGAFRIPSHRDDDAVSARLAAWSRDRVGARIWSKDPTVWFTPPRPETADRLGWLDLPTTMSSRIPELREFAAGVRDEGFRRAVVLGMGGSSLAPDVFAHLFEGGKPTLRLSVLDSTHPESVRHVTEEGDLAHTLFLVSSKSGTTTEPLAFYRYFAAKLGASSSDAVGRQFVAITDPGTPLEALARSRRFRTTFSSPPDVGGRYSALTVFGLVPAALVGVDLDRLLSGARAMADRCGPEVAPASNPALRLGAALGELGRAGRDKITFWASSAIGAYPIWVEQLIAESTGKEGRGLVPVVGERPRAASFYGRDRVVVNLTVGDDRRGTAALDELVDAGIPVVEIAWGDALSIGAECFRWELAIAAAGQVLGIHPFDQPDVQLAKDLARQALARGRAGETEALPNESRPSDVGPLVAAAASGEYVAIQAYLAPTPETDRALTSVRDAIGDRLRVPTTVGYGPRFLHSTGQLHKGGPPSGQFLQIVDPALPDLPIPDESFTFGTLIHAQSSGDATALAQRDRRVVTLTAPAASTAWLGELARWIGRDSARPSETEG